MVIKGVFAKIENLLKYQIESKKYLGNLTGFNFVRTIRITVFEIYVSKKKHSFSFCSSPKSSDFVFVYSPNEDLKPTVAAIHLHGFTALKCFCYFHWKAIFFWAFGVPNLLLLQVPYQIKQTPCIMSIFKAKKCIHVCAVLLSFVNKKFRISWSIYN